MNKKKLTAFALSLVLISGSFAACGNSKTPGTGNDKELKEAPESLSIVSGETTTAKADVTAITAGTDKDGKVVDDKGIIDISGHKIYSTGVKDSNGMLIYTTGKKASNGKILYTKNEKNSFGEQIYYRGGYGSDGELHIYPTTDKPDYSSNNVPVKGPKTEKTTTVTIGYEPTVDFNITDVKSNYIKFFGGSASDTYVSISACKNGGYVTVGDSTSTDGEMNGVDKDYANTSVVVKYDKSGEQLWKYVIGGDDLIYLTAVAELKDESVVAVGSTFATDTAAPLNSQSSSTIIVRIDKDGKLIWMYSFPGDKEQTGDFASCVAATPDGGFVVGGKATTNAGFFSGDFGKIKAYLFKFDKNCNIKWRRILSGSMSNNFQAVSVADNGDIYAVCVTASKDGDFSDLIEGLQLTQNSVLVKLNKKGELQWTKKLDGTGNSEFKAVKALDDGCIVGGNYTVFRRADGIFSSSHGESDIFIIRCSENGDVNWARNFGGSRADYITGITQVDGGFALSGRTKSADYDFQGQKVGGGDDGFVAFISEKGKTCTVYMLDGKNDDAATGICTLSDGTVTASGWTLSKDSAFIKSGANNQYQAFVMNFATVTKTQKTTTTTKK